LRSLFSEAKWLSFGEMPSSASTRLVFSAPWRTAKTLLNEGETELLQHIRKSWQRRAHDIVVATFDSLYENGSFVQHGVRICLSEAHQSLSMLQSCRRPAFPLAFHYPYLRARHQSARNFINDWALTLRRRGLNTFDLVESNRWWTNRGAIDRDILVEEWIGSKFKWKPRLGETLQWDVDIIYVLRGPRQVGKTTLCKLKIRELIRSGVAPRAIFYWACDLIEKPEKLVQIVEGYLAFSKDVAQRRFIFLDEISSVRDWQRGIKNLYDTGRLKDCTVILTGSHSIDIRKATESLARRRGEVHKLRDKLPDKILLPMKFSEYAESRSEEIAQLIRDQKFLTRETRHQLLSTVAGGRLPKELEEANLFLKELDRLYSEYLITGGIPRVVSAFVSEGTITRDIYEGYVELLLKDIRRWGGNEALMRQIVKRSVETMGSPVSLHNLREDTEISSHHTVSSYLDFLRDSFVVTVIYKLDQGRGFPIYRDAKKVHFEDPFIFHAIRSWSLGREPYDEALRYLRRKENLGNLTECVVANHLVRLLFGYFPSTQFDYQSLLFYWQGKKRRELDFVLKQQTRYLPLEVKYQPKISKEDAFGIIDFQKGGKASNGLLLTKGSLDLRRSYLEIPVPLFLLLI